ncbi:MAG: DUF6240 domain-containing protein, partial [Lachnospiraceae bacterium]|nr:DUF6240 domain-containing protein [Lachnospiraceae bacterium]
TKMTVSYSETVMNADKLYEAMHTEVRRDLGDTMGKAFRNVDDILSELQMEATPDNERAVRILAYNEMALTPENISMIKEADALMQRTFKNMTPRTVSDMIKAGENPLDLKLSDLNDMAESFSRENGSHSDEEKFAEFLWKAEHAEGVSDEERQGLIGIFRLIHQVNKNDGAAIGMLIKQGTEVTLRNLMTASRNRKAEGMDFAIDDSFGLVEEFNRNELTITEQIEMSFQSMCMKNTEEEITPFKMMDMGGEEPIMQMTPEELWNRLRETEEPAEIEHAFLQSKREEMKEAVKAEDRIYSMLKEYDIPASPVNLNAAAEFMKDRNASYETLKRFNERLREGSEIKGALEALLNDDDMLLTPEEMQEQAEKREQDTKQVISDFMENEEVNDIDLKALRLVNAKMSVFTKMTREETYNVPITVADQLTNMTVKIVRGAEHKGLVDIALESDITGNMRASMRYENGAITGSVFMSNRGTADLFENHRADFENNIKEATGFNVQMKTGFDRNVDSASVFTERSYGFTETKERDKAETAALYKAAKAFLDSVKELV